MRWNGNAEFLNQKKSSVKIFDSYEIIEWEFRQYTDPLLPFSFYECRMRGLGHQVEGYGVARDQIDAVKKSFAEAWERLWFKKVASSENSKELSIESSTGFAAGINATEASASAKGELIERVVMLTAWTNQVGWAVASAQSLRNLTLILAFRFKGWRIRLYDIQSNVGIVKACLAMHKSYGCIFDTSFVYDNANAEYKVLQSVVKNIFFQNKSDYHDLPFIGNPEDHRLFYANTENSQAFDFLLNPKDDENTVILSDDDKIEICLLHDVGDFPAVAYAKNKFWPQVTWGKQSIQGLNKWPHPLA